MEERKPERQYIGKGCEPPYKRKLYKYHMSGYKGMAKMDISYGTHNICHLTPVRDWHYDKFLICGRVITKTVLSVLASYF